MANRGQSATEFAILIAALLAVFIPLFYLLSDYGLRSGAEIATSQVQQIGQKLVDESREMFVLGLYSKEVVSINMPEGVQRIRTLSINGSAGMEHYLFMDYTTGGESINVTFPSEVALVTPSCSQSACFSGDRCHSCELGGAAVSAGVKHYRLETTLGAMGMSVRIEQVLI